LPANDVTYFGNGNTAGEPVADTTKYIYGRDTVTLPEHGDLYRVGYRFTGWNTKADGSGTQYNEKDQFVMGNDPIQLYARWEEVFPRISAGDGFSTLVTKEGALYATGNNTNGRLGDNTTTDRHEFTAVNTGKLPGPVQWVSSGTDHSFAILRNGSVAGWGRGDRGKLGSDQDDVNPNVLFPTVPSFSGIIGTSIGEIQYISSGRFQTAILNDKGDYWATGTRYYGALGNGEPGAGSNREKQFKLVAKDVTSIATGQNYILLIKKDGSMWIAGEGTYGKLGTANTSNVPILRENAAIDRNNAMVFVGKNNHSMILKKDGRILSTGFNFFGQLGQGDTTNRQYFTPVINTENTELINVAFASLGDNHSMILKKDGTLWATGRNNDSQLGISTTGNQTRAIQVLDHVAHVAAGYNHTLAVKEDGTLWAAGSNASGQFGRKASTTNSLWTEIDISKIMNPKASAAPDATEGTSPP
jgi:uncharacterized repeat protein (TIGR02543 family)